MHHLKQCLTLEDRLLRQVKSMLDKACGLREVPNSLFSLPCDLYK